MQKFSVLMAFYNKDIPEFLSAAMNSLIEQTYLPSELVLIQDGPVDKSLEKVVDVFVLLHKFPIKVIKNEKNLGLAASLAKGLPFCSHELVARMDADDICFPDRFEIQIKKMTEVPEIDVLGTWIAEFSSSTSKIENIKTSPKNFEIRKYSHFRNPINHPSVMFRKSKVLDSGNYRNFQWFEDYELWLRMLSRGAVFDNIQAPLLYFRNDERFLERRRGKEYAKKEKEVFQEFRSKKYISDFEYFYGLLMRKIARLIPKTILKVVYTHILRRKTGR